MAHTRGMLQPRVWRPLSRLLGILTILQTCMESDRLAFYVEFLSYCATHTWCMQHRQSMVGGCTRTAARRLDAAKYAAARSVAYLIFPLVQDTGFSERARQHESTCMHACQCSSCSNRSSCALAARICS